MNEFLAQAFGENGALAAKSGGATIAVLLLALLVYWVGRRFPRMRLNGTSRGRAPRLSIVETVPVDARRRLLLVRRDTVEHLILIGGPSDVVIEPSIVRPRQRPAQAAADLVPAASAASIAALVEEALGSAAASMPNGAAADARVEPHPPFAFSSISQAPAAAGRGDNGPADSAASDFGPAPAWFTAHEGMLPILDAAPDGFGNDIPVPGDRIPTLETSISASPDRDAPSSPTSDSAAHTVSELEAEMNRLLGQFSTNRRSN
jgi:flagellar protein FliO/FliZ